jgi:hypothetical protein
MMRAGLILAGLLHIGGVASLPAQQRPAPFLRWEPAALSPARSTSGQTAERRSEGLGDYRYEGLAFGGLVFGALGVYLGSRISGACPLEPGVPCPSTNTENAIALGLAGAALGGGLGYLVGRFSPKKPPRIELDIPSADLVGVPDSLRKQTGYQHWRGAGLGLVIGGAVGALTGAIAGGMASCSDCSRQPTAGNGAVTLGLLGAGAGGVLGFLAGLASPKYTWVQRGAQQPPQ